MQNFLEKWKEKKKSFVALGFFDGICNILPRKK